MYAYDIYLNTDSNLQPSKRQLLFSALTVKSGLIGFLSLCRNLPTDPLTFLDLIVFRPVNISEPDRFLDLSNVLTTVPWTNPERK